MLINLSDISVRNKLLAPVVLLIILFIIVLYFYRDINSVIDNAEERFSSSKEIISHINAIAKHTDTFTTTCSSYFTFLTFITIRTIRTVTTCRTCSTLFSFLTL